MACLGLVPVLSGGRERRGVLPRPATVMRCVLVEAAWHFALSPSPQGDHRNRDTLTDPVYPPRSTMAKLHQRLLSPTLDSFDRAVRHVLVRLATSPRCALVDLNATVDHLAELSGLRPTDSIEEVNISGDDHCLPRGSRVSPKSFLGSGCRRTGRKNGGPA